LVCNSRTSSPGFARQPLGVDLRAADGLVAGSRGTPYNAASTFLVRGITLRRDRVLDEIFKLQAELNKKIGFDTQDLRENFDPQTAGQWLNDYIAAASNELEELRDCTFWKHWCAEAKEGRRFALHDLQNARVEVIDLLFFWVSMAQCVGLGAQDVYKLYLQKLKINHKRQDDRYSMTAKDETDNRRIALDE
jgi:hypothetical protein